MDFRLFEGLFNWWYYAFDLLSLLVCLPLLLMVAIGLTTGFLFSLSLISAFFL
jgi:hypothetical protein